LLTCYLLRPLPLRTCSAQIIYFPRLTARPRAPHVQIRHISFCVALIYLYYTKSFCKKCLQLEDDMINYKM